MKERILEAIKKIIKPESRKRFYENLALAAILGIILIIVGNTFFAETNKSIPKDEDKTQSVGLIQGDLNLDELSKLETSLQNILVKIKGAGRVSVMLTAYGQNEISVATDKKQSENQQKEFEDSKVSKESSETQNEESVTYQEENGQKKPIVLKEIMPQIKGVLVVCSGAGSPSVRENITNAVVALFDIPVYKVKVVEGG